VAASWAVWYYLSMSNYSVPEPVADLINDVEAEDTYLTRYETDCFCEGACGCLSEDETAAAEAAAEAEYDAWEGKR